MRWFVLFTAIPAFAVGPVIPNYAPPDTKVVIGIELRRLLDSPLAKGASISQAKLPIPQIGGIDFLKDVDELLITTSAEGQNPPALLLLRGRFHPSGSSEYHGVPVWEASQKPSGLLAILDPTTAIAGDAALVHAAIDHRAEDGSSFPELEARIQPLSGKYDIWGAGERIPKSAQPGQMDSIDAFSFGVTFQDGLDAVADLHLRSAADVQKVRDFLKFFGGMLQSQSGGGKFHVGVERNSLHVAFFVPKEQLKKAMQTQMDTLMSAFAKGMSSTPFIPPVPKTEGKILTNEHGDTARVVLPGGGR